jgi:hypothetical protein
MTFSDSLRIYGFIASCVISHAASAGVVDYCYCEPSCSDPNHHQRPGMNNGHWYSRQLRADDHGHTWHDYTFMADCYHEDWRTTKRWEKEKSADTHRRTRDHSLAVEAAWGKTSKKAQNGYCFDTSGRPLLHIPRPQSERGMLPNCWPMFGGQGLMYPRYVYRPLTPSTSPVIDPDCPPALAAKTAKSSWLK